MCINSNSSQHMNDQYGLDRSTFKFMIESDETIKVQNPIISLELIKNLPKKNIPQTCSPSRTSSIANSNDK